MESRSCTVDGIEMRWEESGQGFPLVLVHGIPTSPALWRRVVPRLSGFRCLAWEMVGYGASIPQGRDRDISVSGQADHLAAWLRALNIPRAILAGHDLGGGVVQIAAVRHPGICAGLLLTNAICYDSWPIPSVKAMQATRVIVARTPEPALRAGWSGAFSSTATGALSSPCWSGSARVPCSWALNSGCTAWQKLRCGLRHCISA